MNETDEWSRSLRDLVRDHSININGGEGRMSNRLGETVIEVLIIILGGLTLYAGITILLAFPIKWLWNWLIQPQITKAVFGVEYLDIWKSLGLSFLIKLLSPVINWNTKSKS